jgi:hypothetical protein
MSTVVVQHIVVRNTIRYQSTSRLSTSFCFEICHACDVVEAWNTLLPGAPQVCFEVRSNDGSRIRGGSYEEDFGEEGLLLVYYQH